VTIADLIEKYSYIDWLGYINSKMYAGLKFNESDVVILQQPTYYDQLEAILNQTDKSTIANYILWRELADYIPYLNSDLRALEFEFMRTITGKATKTARWSDCIKVTSGMMSVAISAMYVREYFNVKDIKDDIGQIIKEISSEFEKVLIKNDWMDVETKSEALKKLKAMHSNIAYPDELLDNSKLENYYKGLKLNETNYLQSAIALDNHGKNFICERFNKPVNRTDWVDHASSIYVNANYNGKTNSIQIIAAMLQGHFYANDRPDYMNYASIGYVIGHEMTHGFDDLGRLYDSEGNLREWWHEDTKKAFNEKKNCIIEQYGNFTEKSVNMSLNGVITQGENIADNGGLKLAYSAYIASVKKSATKDPVLPGLPFSPEQLFWISAAQTWCSVERPEVKKLMILTDNHALGRYRVLGTLTNSDEFAKDFNCAWNSPMNPPNKCVVW
jgi:neprilysin